MNPTTWKIDKPHKKWADAEIEPLLWHYPQYKLELDMQKLDPSCISNYDGFGMPRSPGNGDSTAQYGIKRAESDNPNYVLCRKIEMIYERLQPDLQSVCEMYYWQKLKPSVIAERLNISYRTLWRWLHGVIYFYGTNLTRKG